MSERRRYLNNNGEFVGRDGTNFSEVVFEDEEITLDDFRKKNSSSQGEKNGSQKRAASAEERARRLIISRANEQQRYSRLSNEGGSRSRTRAAEHLLEHGSRSYAEPQEEPERDRKKAAQKNNSSGKKTQSSSKGSKKKRKRKKQRNTLVAMLLFIAVVIGCCAVLYYSLMGIIFSGINHVDIPYSYSDEPSSEVANFVLKSSSNVKNILILGLDDEGGTGSRSDTMMIISIDSRNNTLRMCSILRDSWVEIPDIGKRKINAAYAYGSAPLAVRTVESNFRVKIDGYVSIDIDSLTDVIDIIGGVDIEISAEEAKYLNIHSQSAILAYEGMQHMDGKLATCYARIRKLDSDFGRTSRQRTLINAIIKKCKNDFTVPELLRLAGTIAPYITTSLSSSEIATLVLKAAPTLVNDTEQLSIPAEGTFEYGYAGDQAVIYLDLEENVTILHEFLYKTVQEVA